MIEIQTIFSDTRLDRCSVLRTDPDALNSALLDPTTRFLPIHNDRCLVRDNEVAYVKLGHVADYVGDNSSIILLGRRREQLLFALPVDERYSGKNSGERFASLREISMRVSEDDAAVLAYARAMVNWQRSHRYCGSCGHPNQVSDGGFLMLCSNAACAKRSFPRLDPAIIVLIHRGTKCLLGRQKSWPERRFSTIAGYVEPGESIENAVRREVHEETNIRVGACHYLASQPWPFPSALMIGFHGEALSDDIRLNDGELAEAIWIDRAEIAAGKVLLPPPLSVAFRLIETWFDQSDHYPPLATLTA